MRRILAADLMLLRVRRTSWLVLVVALLAIGFFGYRVIAELEPPTAAEMAQGEAAYEREFESWQANHQEWQDLCEQDGGSADECRVAAPTREQFQPWHADFAWVSQYLVLLTAAALSLGMYLVGAAFVGADYTSGVASTWLTYLAHRNVVLFSKYLVIVLLAVLASAVTFTLGLLLALAAGSIWDVPVPDGQLSTAVLQAVRGAGLVVLSSVLGVSAATITRRASAAIGIAAAYVLIVVLSTSLVVGLTRIAYLDFITMANIWITGSMTLTAWDHTGPRELYISTTAGGVSWLALTAVSVVLAGVVNRVRDIH